MCRYGTDPPKPHACPACAASIALSVYASSALHIAKMPRTSRMRCGERRDARAAGPRRSPLTPLDRVVRLIEHGFPRRIDGTLDKVDLEDLACAVYVVNLCGVELASSPGARDVRATCVLFDEENDEMAVVRTIDPGLMEAKEATEATHATEAQDVVDSFVEQKQMAMRVGQMFGVGVVVIRDVLWRWVEHWCKRTGRSLTSRICKILANTDLDPSEYFIALGLSDIFKITPRRVCRACGGPGISKCARVGCIARYCSAECQRKDWRTHRASCGRYEPGSVDSTDFVEWLAAKGCDDELCNEFVSNCSTILTGSADVWMANGKILAREGSSFVMIGVPMGVHRESDRSASEM